jgi:hypothetical protein
MTMCALETSCLPHAWSATRSFTGHRAWHALHVFSEHVTMAPVEMVYVCAMLLGLGLCATKCFLELVSITHRTAFPVVYLFFSLFLSLYLSSSF